MREIQNETTSTAVMAGRPVLERLRTKRRATVTSMETNLQRTITYLTWAALDGFYIVWYCVNSWTGGRSPYLTDFNATLSLLEQQGGINAATAVTSWLVQLSIIFSCLLFLCRAQLAKYLAYIQIPFRLFFLLPSVSALLLAAQFLPGFSLLFLVLIILSELLKGWSLWRLA
jgi:hypothetical protein